MVAVRRPCQVRQGHLERMVASCMLLMQVLSRSKALKQRELLRKIRSGGVGQGEETISEPRAYRLLSHVLSCASRSEEDHQC